jgi:RND family efflux transporter MFP subunit
MIAARKELDQAYATLNWYTGKPSDQDYAEADAKLALAETQLAEAEQAWERLKEGVDELELELANARLDNARVKLASAEAVLASLELTAPFDGVVLEVDAQPGEALAVGQAVLVLSDPKAVEVQATVIEEDLPYVETGQGVDLFFDALPDVEAHGRVDRILPKRLPGDRPLYTIYITLDDVPDKLVDGMTADASIVIAQRESVLCLPRGVVRASSSGTAVIEVWTGTEIERRTIEIGLRGDVQVEILSGLEEGELVVAK